MRTVSAPYLAIVNGVHYNIYALVQVERADGSYQELTSFLGMDWLEELHWGENIDQPVASGTVVVGREHTGPDGVAISLAPGVQDSPANIVGGVYSPLLAESRGIRWQVAVTAPGVAPVAGDYIPLFVGKIDDVDAKGLEGQITLSVRDRGAWLLDTQIQTKRTYGGTPTSPVDITTTMRQIIADNLQPKVNGGAPETLYVWGSPAFNINQYEQSNDGMVLPALRDLADLIGGDVRYRWQPDGVTFGLTFSVPDRAKTVEDWTLGPDDYFNVTELKQSDLAVRNMARVRYTDYASGLPLFQDATNGTSLLAHGLRYMEVGEDVTSQIDTAAEALTMATAIVSDLADPTSESEVETMFFPVVELNDLGKFLANGKHYDRDRRLAVVQYKHDLTRESHRTSIQHRGKVTGGYWKWLGKAGAGTGTGTLPTFRETASTYDGGGYTRATLQVDVTDPDNRITLFQFAVGRTLGTLGSWITAAPPSPYIAFVDLFEGDTGFIAYRAVGQDLSGNYTELARRAIGVGTARTPHIDSVVASFPDALTTTRLTARGDALVGSWRLQVRTDRAPTAAEVRAATLIAGQNITADYTLTVPVGTSLYIAAFAYGNADGSGIESAMFMSTPLREGSGAAEAPTATITLTAESDIDVTVTLNGVLGRGSGGPLEYRTRTNIQKTPGTFSAWASASTFPLSVVVPKNFKMNKVLELETRQGGGLDGQFGRDVLSVVAVMAAIDPTDGRSDRTATYSTASGGGYGAYATDTTGYTLGTNNRDSRLQAINSLFAKGADTLDQVVDGGTYGRPLSSRLNAGNPLIDFAAAYHLGKNVDNLADGSTYFRTTSNEKTGGGRGFGGFVNATGGLASTATDAFAHPVTDSFFRSTHTLDQVVDGGTYSRPLGSRLSAGKPLIDFAESIHVNKTVDFVGDGSTYLRAPQFSGGDNLAENGNFEASAALLANGAPPGYGPNAATLSYETGTPYAGAQSLKVVTATQFGGASGLRRWKVRPGDQYRVSCRAKTLAGATAWLFVDVLDTSGAAVIDDGPTTASASWAYMEKVVTVPAGGVTMALCLRCSTVGGGTVWFDDVSLTRVQALDADVADGATYRRPTLNEATGGGRGFGGFTNGTGGLASTAADSFAHPVTDSFFRSTHTLDAITDGGTYGRPLSSRLNAGNPLIDFAAAYHLGKNVDNLADGSTYFRTTSNEKTGGARGFGGFTNSTGVLVSTATDSGSHQITDSFFRSTHTADAITDGATKRAIGFATIDSGNNLLGGIAGKSAQGVASSAGGIFFGEDFTEGTYWSGRWNSVNTAGTTSLVAATGQTGGTVLQLQGLDWRYAGAAIKPFNPSKLYRLRARYRQTVDPTNSGGSGVFLGFVSLDVNGAQIGGNYGNYLLESNHSATVAEGWREITAFVRGANNPVTSASQTPASSPAVTGFGVTVGSVYVGTVYVVPMWIFNYASGNGTAQLDYFQIEEVDEDAATRTYTALRSDGTASAGFKQYDGTNVKSYARGGLAGSVQNNQTLLFGLYEQFISVPAVNLLGGGALSRTGTVWRVNDTGSSFVAQGAGDVYDDTHAVNQTRQQFTCRARLRQKATTSPASASFPSSNAATSVGADTGNAVTSGGPSNSDHYTVYWNLVHTVNYIRPSGSGSSVLVIAIDADPTGTGAWTECLTVNYNDSADVNSSGTPITYDDSGTVTVTGFTTSGRFRLRVKSQSNTLYTSATFTLHGYVAGTDAQPGVVYTTSTGDLYASRTPGSGDFIDYTLSELAY